MIRDEEEKRPAETSSPAPRGVDVRCDRIATPGGSDRDGKGTSKSPYASPARLLEALDPGGVGCLRDGTYDRQTVVTVRTPRVTLRSFPGERAVWRGRIVVLAPEVTLEHLVLDGSCPEATCRLPSPTVSAPGATVSDNEITNRHTGICLHTRAFRGSAPTGFVFERNRIHDCGRLPPTNRDHGVYLSDGSADGIVRDNVIFDNADRGIQLFPEARDVSIYRNTIDGNGVGVLLSRRSTGTIVERNVIANSSERWNVEWFELSGKGNVIRDNCLWPGGAAEAYRADGGIQADGRELVGLARNQVAEPSYRNRDAGDLRLSLLGRCAGRGAPPDVAAPPERAARE